MRVPYRSLLKLGNNLELDEDRIYAILATTQYQEEEKRQRVVELWFRKEAEPTWEGLHRGAPLLLLTGAVTSLHLGESSTSMDSAQPLPVLSPSLTKYVCGTGSTEESRTIVPENCACAICGVR